MAVAAVGASGGDGGVRAERTEEGESVRGRERESLTALGVAWHCPDASRRSQAGRKGGGGGLGCAGVGTPLPTGRG